MARSHALPRSGDNTVTVSMRATLQKVAETETTQPSSDTWPKRVGIRTLRRSTSLCLPPPIRHSLRISLHSRHARDEALRPVGQLGLALTSKRIRNRVPARHHLLPRTLHGLFAGIQGASLCV